MINNFKLVQEIYSEEFENQLFMIQILKRRKENPELSKNSKTVDFFYCKSIAEIKELEEKIVEKCNKENARAYLWINRRNVVEVALKSSSLITEWIRMGQAIQAKNAFQKAFGAKGMSAESQKKWIIDIDTKDAGINLEIIEKISTIKEDAIIATIPTPNGFHLITTGFDTRTFNEELDIKKDNPTILYAV